MLVSWMMPIRHCRRSDRHLGGLWKLVAIFYQTRRLRYPIRSARLGNIIDQYCTFRDQNATTLVHVARGSLSAIGSFLFSAPTFKDCYEYYTPPNPASKFSAQSLGAELDNRVLNAATALTIGWLLWNLRSLTRLLGRLDAATAGLGNDPYLALPAGKPTAEYHRADVAAPVCQLGDPLAWEVTIEECNKTFWQEGRFTCPSSWEQTLEGPIFDNPAAGTATKVSLALSLHDWTLNDVASTFAQEQLQEILALHADPVTVGDSENDDGDDTSSEDSLGANPMDSKPTAVPCLRLFGLVVSSCAALFSCYCGSDRLNL